MKREQAINYLFSCGFTNEQVCEVVRALTYELTTKNDLGVDCISRQAVIDEMEKRHVEGDCITKGFIKNLPSVTPQEPRKGKWVHKADMDYLDKNGATHNHFMCNKCGFIHDFIDGHTSQYSFCPSCRADMREVEE